MNDTEGLNKIMKGAGVILIIMGILVMWRGIFRLIPYAGFAHGIGFTIGGAIFTLLGIFFLLLPKRLEKRKQEKLAQQQQAGQDPSAE